MTVRQAENFREKLPSANSRGKRLWIYPKQFTGKFYNYRKLLSYFQLGFLFAAPFIKLNDYPLLMFNIVERKVSIFGKVFWPQDFYIFVLAMINFFVGIFLFTTIYGRVWCGWLCPQTIFMEMLFRRIEYFIEGDRSKYMKRQRNGLTDRDKTKRVIKHIIFFILSFAIGNLFLAYIIGGDGLIEIITAGLSAHPVGLASMLVFSLFFYWLYAYFREQFCCFLCPYARLQSVMYDDNTISVIYDHKRGESRGKRRKGQDHSKMGDCIDCGLCQKVCPTGIDIRDSYPQLECINCTACIDACDGIMDKLGQERGLIRYGSKSSVEKGLWSTFARGRLPPFQ